MHRKCCHKNILVADKRDGICAMMRFMLAQLGAQVVTASDADQILALAAQHESAIAFVDLDLARGDTLALSQQLRQLRPGMTVVLMYAYATQEELAGICGQDDLVLLPKPFELSEIKEIVKGRCAR